MALARSRGSVVRRGLALLATAALAAMPMATIGVAVTPTAAAADSPVYPAIDATYEPAQGAFATDGIINLAVPPTSGPANPDPGSVTAVAGGSPLQSAAILKSDLAGSQLASIKLVSLGLESLPVSLPLSSMPLTRTTSPKTWDEVLAPTVLANIPLVNVTWSQLVALGAAQPPAVSQLTLADVDWSGSPLRDLPLAAFTFGGANVTSELIPLQAGEDGGDTTAAQRWCYLLNRLQAGSCSSPASLTGKSLIDLGVQGAPLKDIPLKDIPLKDIDLSSSPLKDIPLKDIVLQVSPLKDIPLKDIALASSPLKDIPLKDIDLATSPLKDIPLKDIAWASSPLKDIPLKDINLATSPLKDIPLKDIDFALAPLKDIPLKDIAAASSPLKDIPLKDINFALAPLKDIPLKDIALSSTPLKDIPLKDIAWTPAALGAASLSQFDLASAALASIPVVALANPAHVVGCAAATPSTCAVGETLGAAASAHDILLTATLADIGASGFAAGGTLADLLAARIAGSSVNPTLGDLRLDLAAPGTPDVTIAQLLDALSGSVAPPVLGDLAPFLPTLPTLGDLRLDRLASGPAMTVGDLLAALGSGTPDVLLGDLRIDTMANPPALTLASFFASLQSSSQSSVSLGDLSLDTATGVDAYVVNAVSAFLLAPDAFAPYLLGALGTYTTITGHDITLGELGTWKLGTGSDITLGALAKYLDGSVSLSDVLLGLVPASQFPYENFPVDSLGLDAGHPVIGPLSPPGGGDYAASPITPPVLQFNQRFANSAPFDAAPADLVFTLPPGAQFSSVSTADNAPSSITRNASGRVQVVIPNVAMGHDTLYTVSIAWLPGIRLGESGFDVSVLDHVTGATEDSRTNATPSVIDGAEPNTPLEALAFGTSSPASRRVPLVPVNPNGCSSANSSCTGRDTTYADALLPGYIDRTGDVDWYRIPNVKAGTRITADLTDLPVDADLVLYGPAGISATATSASAFTSSVQGLPGTLVEDPGLGVGQAARALAVNGLNDLHLDKGYTDPFIGDPVAANIPAMTPLSISQHSGTDPESVGVIAPVDGDYTVQVTGYGQAISPNPYLVRVRAFTQAAEATCPARVFANGMGTPTSSIPTIGSDVNALILTNPSRLAATYGPGASGADGVASSLTGFVSWLGDPAQAALGTKAAVIPLDAYTDVQSAYQAWDNNPCSVSAANKVASSITAVIAGIRLAHPGISSITIIGGDDIIPMGRVADLTRVSNESEYASTFAASPNPLSAAEAAGYTLTDDNYADPSPTPLGNGSNVYIPRFAVGRLLETPADINGQITKFKNTNGVLYTPTGLVTGYDFLADGARAVASRLGPNRSIDSTLIDSGSAGSPWTKAQLQSVLFPSGGAMPLVDSINAHYDHTALLSDAGLVKQNQDVLTTTDFVNGAATTSLIGRILFTMGCHAGLSVPDAYLLATDPNASALGKDWAQTLSNLGVAVYVANTGYGIGDTTSIAYSERLMALYAKLLDGSVSAGQALVYAKQAYYGSLGAVGVYDLKILQQAEFYGLPFWRVSTAADPSTDKPVPAPTAPGLPGTIGTDASTGLAAMPLTIQPGASQVPPSATGLTPRFWTTSTDDPQVTQFEPIQPKYTTSVVTNGRTAHGALITGLVSSDFSGVVPVINTPTADTTSVTQQVRADGAAWPAKLATVTTSQAPYGRAQSLVLVPGQFLGNTYDGTGVERVFTTVGVKVLYAPDGSTDFTAPAISGATGSAGGNTVTFSATAVDDGSVKAVTVGYRDLDGSWKFAPMTGGPSAFSASVTLSRAATPSDRIVYFVQAVDASGNVGIAAGKADGFVASADTTPPTITTTFDKTPNATGWIGANSVTVSYQCTDGGSGVDPAACPAPREVTTQGTSVVTGSTVDRAGNTASISTTVSLDGDAPSLTADVQPAGWSNAASATVTFSCSDTVSGLDASGCPAPKTITAEGATPVSGSATDLAGNTATVSATVRLDRTAPTISATVAPAPNGAGWSKGASATVTFICTDALSGVASCPGPQTVGQGTTTLSGIATDVAGNSTPLGVTVRVDGAVPTIASTVTPAIPASGWSKAASETVSFTCADALSGIASCTPAQVVTAEGKTPVTGTAVDLAGNSSSVTTTVQIDRTPPAVTVVLSAAPVTPTCKTTDAASGVATAATLATTTTRVNGIPTTTATCSGAKDVAGNASPPVSATFVAPMKFTGFLVPIVNPPYVNVGRVGWVYPVIFGLKDASGVAITALAAVTSTTYQTVACSSLPTQTSNLPSTTTSGTGLINDPITKLYAYLWKTPATVGCYQLQLTLADRSVHVANFKLVK